MASPFGKRGALNVTEAAASARTSYHLDAFAPITASLVNGQGAACWAASTQLDGRYTFTVTQRRTPSWPTPRTGKVSSASSLTPGGATAQLAAGTHPLDEVVSRDRFLYVNGGNTGQISAFRISPNGSLMLLGAFGTLPAGFGGQTVVTLVAHHVACPVWPRPNQTRTRSELSGRRVVRHSRIDSSGTESVEGSSPGTRPRRA